MASQHHVLKWSLGLIGTVLVASLFLYLPDYNRRRTEEQEYKSLATQYWNPDFSPEFCRYWRIDNLDDYKKALDQQFKIARFRAFEVSYGNTEDELIHFVRLRMINWLDQQFTERAEWLLQFERRGKEKVGPYSIDLKPLSEESFREQVPY